MARAVWTVAAVALNVILPVVLSVVGAAGLTPETVNVPATAERDKESVCVGATFATVIAAVFARVLVPKVMALTAAAAKVPPKATV